MKFLQATKISTIVFFVFLIPFLIFLGLYGTKFGQVFFHSHFIHSILLVIVSVVSFYAAYFAYEMYLKNRDPIIFTATLSFYIFGFVFFLHGVIIPEIFTGFPVLTEAIFDVTEHYGLFLGSLIFLGVIFPLQKWRGALYKNRLKILVGLIALLFLWFVSLVIFPRFTEVLKGAIDIPIFLTAIFFLISLVLLMKRYVQKPNILLFYFILGFAVLVNSAIIPFFYEEWGILWWYFHLITLFGFVIILLGLVKSRKEETRGRLEEVFDEIPVHSKISTKIATFALTTALVPIISVLFIGFNVFENSMREQAIKNMVLVAEAQEGQLLIFIEGLNKRTVDFSSDGFIRNFVKNIIEDPLDQETIQLFNQHLRYEKMVLSDSIYGINILDLSGKIIASTHEAEIGKDESKDDYFRKSLNLNYGETNITDVEIGHHFDTNIFSINISAILIDEESKEKIGIIIIYFNAKHLSDVLAGKHQIELGALSGTMGRGATTDVYLVNKDKLLITKSRYLDKSEILKQVVDNEPIDACLSEQKEVAKEWRNYRGAYVFGASMCLPDYDWTLLAEIEETEVLLPVVALKRTFVVIVSSILFFILLFGIYFSRHLTRPIEALAEVSEKISRGDTRVRAKVGLRNEIGILARSFNEMTDSLVRANRKFKESNLRLIIKNMEAEELTKNLQDAEMATLNILEDLKIEKDKVEKEAKNTKKFQQAVESSTEGIVITTPDSKIIYANSAWLKLTGYTLKETLGKGANILKSKNTPTDIYKDMWQALTKQESFTTEDIINKRKDGSEYKARLAVSPVVVNGKTIFYIGVTEDITARKKVDRMKSEFITIASHQLRTPLTSIRWVIELFLKKEKLTKKGKEYLQDVHTSAQRLSDLVDILLNVSRIEEGDVSVSPRSLELVSFISGYLKELGPLSDKKNLTIGFEHPKELKVSTDESALRNIIQSLVSNAIEYTLPGGKIDVTLEKNEHEFYITIADTGIGIPKSEQEHIAHKFTRGSNAMLVKTDGTGMGLYIAYEAVRLLGGKIWFESEENKGARFHVTLPMESKEVTGERKLV